MPFAAILFTIALKILETKTRHMFKVNLFLTKKTFVLTEFLKMYYIKKKRKSQYELLKECPKNKNGMSFTLFGQCTDQQ